MVIGLILESIRTLQEQLQEISLIQIVLPSSPFVRDDENFTQKVGEALTVQKDLRKTKFRAEFTLEQHSTVL